MFSIDHNLYKRVREAKALEGQAVPNVLPFNEFDDLIGYNIYDKGTGQKYIVSHFLKYWYDGWCVVAVLQRIDSDGHAELIRLFWDKHQSRGLDQADCMQDNFVTTVREVCYASR